MANSTIQIKRSTTLAIPTVLANGELAFSSAANVLYIGNPAATNDPIPIAGKRFPGTLTANQAIVVDSSSFIDAIKVSGQATMNVIVANGSTGTDGKILTSNATGGIYWSTPIATTTASGSDTYVQFNDGGTAFGGTDGFSFDKITNNVNVGNTLIVPTVNATSNLTVSTNFIANATGAYHTGTINAASYTIGALFTANSTLVNAAAINVTDQVNTSTLYATTSANVGSAFLANTTGVYHTGTVNADNFAIGSNFIANSTAIVGTGFANVTQSVNSALLTVGTNFIANTTGAYHTGTINAASYTIGALFTANSTLVNTTAINVTGQVNTATLYAATSANVGTEFLANTTGVYHTGTVNAASHTVGSNFIANTTALVHTGFANVTTSVNSALLTVGTNFIANTTGAYHTGTVNAANLAVGSSFIANTSRVTISGVPLQANGSVGSQGQVLASNGATGSPYWTASGTPGGSTTQIQFNDASVFGGSAGFTFTKTTNNVFIANTLGVGTTTSTGQKIVLASTLALDAATQHLYSSLIIGNTSITQGRTHQGNYSLVQNRSQHTNGVTVYDSTIYAHSAVAINGGDANRDAYAGTLAGGDFRARNMANGVTANSVGTGYGTYTEYQSSGPGNTGTAYGLFSLITAANNSVSGNITNAFGVRSSIRSNTAMTISTGYLFYGTHEGLTTTTKYGVFVNNEANNYFSANVVIGGSVNAASYYVGTNFIANTSGAYITRDGNPALSVNRLTSDGDLVLLQKNGVTEGAISVAGTTVTYGAFAGAHWSQLSDNSRPNILRGTVVETIDEMCQWENEQNDQLVKFKISDTVASKFVYGIFQTWDNDDDSSNDANIVSLGAYLIRIAAGVIVAKGDLLESAGNGCARVQSDDIIRSSTIGKVTNGSHVIETYEDGSYLVPCVLYCG